MDQAPTERRLAKSEGLWPSDEHGLLRQRFLAEGADRTAGRQGLLEALLGLQSGGLRSVPVLCAPCGGLQGTAWDDSIRPI